MDNKTKEFSLGKIIYRMPNVVESMRLLGKIGVKANGSTDARGEFEMMADLIDHMAPFVLEVKAEKDGKAITTWDEALKHVEFVKPLTELGTELLSQFGDKESGKQRKKR